MRRRPFRRSGIRVPIIEAINCMVYVLGSDDGNRLLCSTVVENGFVGPGACFSLKHGYPSAEVLFELPRRLDAPAVLFGSRAKGSVFEPAEADTRLFDYLVAAGESAGIPVLEHVLVQEGMFRLMRSAGEPE